VNADILAFVRGENLIKAEDQKIEIHLDVPAPA
jgi:hypothetical protein